MEIEEVSSSPLMNNSNKSVKMVNTSNPMDVHAEIDDGKYTLESMGLANLRDVFLRIEDLEYLQASNVNVSNFVSVKLSGEENYEMWKDQMLCLLESQQMLGIVDEKYPWPAAKSHNKNDQYNSLVKGWIYSTINEKVFSCLEHAQARGIWKELEYQYRREIRFAANIFPSSEKNVVTIQMPEQRNDENELKIRLRAITLEWRWWKAKSILKNHKDAAMEAINENGDTILHLAVEERKNYFVQKLLNFIKDEEQLEIKNSDGHTALHIAAIVGNQCAAELLVNKRKELLDIEDNETYLPLVCAYFKEQLNTFLYLWEATQKAYQLPPLDFNPRPAYLTGINMLNSALRMKQYELAEKLINLNPYLVTSTVSPMYTLTINFPRQIDFVESLIYPALKNVREKLVKRLFLLFNSLGYILARAEDILWTTRSLKHNRYSLLLPELFMLLLVPVGVIYVVYQFVRLLILMLRFPFSMLYFFVWKVLAVAVTPIKNIEKKKKEYKKGRDILHLMCDKINTSTNSEPCRAAYDGTMYQDIYSFLIMVAVHLDVFEVVVYILCVAYDTLYVQNKQGLNIIQLIVLNRSENIYNCLYPMIERTYRTIEDSSGNNLAHLVGRLAPSVVLSRTTGAALQLQRELQWREELEKLMMPMYLTHENNDFETPEMVFTREHADLMKEGERWMKTTAESCSITAALITTIVFAAAITVPGGTNQEKGTPLFKNHISFTIFAVSDAISLFSATTALLVFLSILTARFAEKDFLFSLPRRLFLGLCALYVSTTAMMVAFGAILFLVFCDQGPWMLAPIGVLACLPISVIVTLQLPLVVDLYQSTYIPRFSQQKNLVNPIHW